MVSAVSAVVVVRPQVEAVTSADQLRRDAQSIARAPHRPLDNVLDPEAIRNLGDRREVVALEHERRGAGGYQKFGQLSERVEDLLGSGRRRRTRRRGPSLMGDERQHGYGFFQNAAIGFHRLCRPLNRCGFRWSLRGGIPRVLVKSEEPERDNEHDDDDPIDATAGIRRDRSRTVDVLFLS